MKKLSRYFSAVSGIFAVLPGLAVLLSNIGVPPNSSKILFSGVIESLGVLTLMILLLNKEWIIRLSNRSINFISITTIGIFILALFSYIFLYNYLVVGTGISDPVFFPLWAQRELMEGIIQVGNRSELINEWGRDDVVKVIQASSQGSLLITTMIMLVIYQLIFVSLTFSFGILGIKGSEKS